MENYVMDECHHGLPAGGMNMSEIPDISRPGGRGEGSGRERDGGGKYSGYCYCPNCGGREPFQFGVPCYLRKCSKCGALMTDMQPLPEIGNSHKGKDE